MAISVDNTYITPYSTDAVDFSADKVSAQIQQAETDEETLDACRQFEAYMIQQMYKNMERTAKVFSDDDDDSSNQYIEMFSDTYLEDIANKMVYNGQGLGIAEQLYDSIKKQNS
ncbi:MAG: rod-binding protein [Lachnospiraceae bacterium]|nr:rod-binding protein [Lachnospiraceae bacterium]